uniref:MHYT domain-containing protein n=1 Tax=Chromera velia CCMP2878 TaxID=1169474 RepID=A0A0G4GL60_9ALVE|eukprot:Cvel_22391.t1-p1 / transcript=Cvel_22391.t1 / gene=Cvel_22391 / organism=Chromera_velia_CCMP2878 / gene_product=hypothetical protein / transcript_product=hypothetical protein / location=Cvel_scaffold2195:22710-29100(+) / protein_length=563 / sequence_SO=supercontig / SO=protein_coding / is_pseudo=false
MSVSCNHAILSQGCTVEPCLYEDGEELGYIVQWPPLVLSMVYASVGAWVGLQYSQNLRTVATLKWYLILLFGLSFSFSILSIWTMHFVAMTSITLGRKSQTLFYEWEDSLVPISDRQYIRIKYNIYWTVFSAICVFIFSVLGFHVVAWRPLHKTYSPSFWRTLLGGALLASGVALMHFIGLHAQAGAFRIEYNYFIILGVGGLDVTVCIVGAFCFFWLPNMTLIRVVVSFVVGCAAFTVHFAGMYPLTYIYSDNEPAYNGHYFTTGPLVFALALSICQVSLEAVVVAYEYQKALSSNKLLESLIRMVKESKRSSEEEEGGDGDKIFRSSAFKEAGAFNVHVTVQALPGRNSMRNSSTAGPAFDGNLADFVKFMSKKMSRRQISPMAPPVSANGENTDAPQGNPEELVEGDPSDPSDSSNANDDSSDMVVDHTSSFAPGATQPPIRETSPLQMVENVVNRMAMRKRSSRLTNLHENQERRPLARKDTEKTEKAVDMNASTADAGGAHVSFPDEPMAGGGNPRVSIDLETGSQLGIAEEDATVSPVNHQPNRGIASRGVAKQSGL